MKTYFTPFRILICLTGLLLLVGCDDSPTATQPQVVRKKLAKPAEQPAPPVAVASAPARQPGPPPAPAATPPSVAAKAPAPPATPAAGSKPPASPPPPPPTGAPATHSEAGLMVTDSQIAALLNIKIPPPYNPKGKVDPFEPLLRDETTQTAVAANKLHQKKRVPQSPLEKIDLGQLKLVAIISAPTGNRAMVEEASGKGYIIRTGTYIGLNSGKVVEITPDTVRIEEEFEDAYGKTVIKKKEIKLPKPPGEL